MTPGPYQTFDVVKHMVWTLVAWWRLTITKSKSTNGISEHCILTNILGMLLSGVILPSSERFHLLHLFNFCAPSPHPFSTSLSCQEDSERYSHPSHAQAVCIPPYFPYNFLPLVSFNSLTSEHWKEPNLVMDNLSQALPICCSPVMTNSCFSNSAVCTITLNICLRFSASSKSC